MAHAGQQKEAYPEQPAELGSDAEHHQGAHGDVRDDTVKAWGDGVEDVATIELACRNEIERRDEDGDP